MSTVVAVRSKEANVTGIMATPQPLTSLHSVLVQYFAESATMNDVRRAVVVRGYQLESRGARGAPIVADVKAIARQAARRASCEIDERTWQNMLAPLEIFFQR
ncbi:MAG: hypothetical protein ACR2M1_11245 [Gemmatimonadaceae bacterium]